MLTQLQLSGILKRLSQASSRHRAVDFIGFATHEGPLTLLSKLEHRLAQQGGRLFVLGERRAEWIVEVPHVGQRLAVG